MKKDHSKLLSDIAKSLHSSAKQLEYKAKEIEQQNPHAGPTARAKCTERWKVWHGKMEDEKETDTVADRVVLGAMEAANAIKQDSIIRDAVESLLESTTPELCKSIDPIQDRNEDSVCEISSDDIALFVCNLAAQILADPQLSDQAEESQDGDTTDGTEDGEETYDNIMAEHDNCMAFLKSDSHSSSMELQRSGMPEMPEAGFGHRKWLGSHQ